MVCKVEAYENSQDVKMFKLYLLNSVPNLVNMFNKDVKTQRILTKLSKMQSELPALCNCTIKPRVH